MNAINAGMVKDIVCKRCVIYISMCIEFPGLFLGLIPALHNCSFYTLMPFVVSELNLLVQTFAL